MQQGLRSGFELSESRLDVARLRQDLKRTASTALVTAEGLVGPEYQGKMIERMDCEIYETLALAEGARIIQEALGRFAIDDALLVHRTGRLVVGEAFYWAGVTGKDEVAAQTAMRYLLEQMRLRLPLWCKAHFKDGSSVWCDASTNENQPAAQPEATGDSEAPMMNPDEDLARKTPEKSLETGYYKMKATASETTMPAEKALTPALYYQTQLSSIGEEGQQKLARARVLVVGAGSLGNAALAYLAGAGVGLLSVCDAGRLQVGHLHRQPLYGTADIGKNKAILAAERLNALNPFVRIQVQPKKLERHNAQGLFNAHDLILDCSNDAQTHSLLNEAAVAFQKPLIQVGIWGDEGQIYLYQPGIDGCLRCQWAAFGTAANQNVLNAAGGLLGSMQALEALKLLLGLSTPLSQHVLHFNLLSCQTRLTQKVRNPYCPVCQTYLPKTPPAEVAVTPPHAESSADPDWMVFIDSRNEAQLSSYVLIDVSETREHTTFPGHPCLNMPFSRFNLEAPRLDRSHRYLLYCQKGTRSLHLTRELRRRGYTNVFALAGGIARLQSPQEASTRPLESKAAVELAKPTAG